MLIVHVYLSISYKVYFFYCKFNFYLYNKMCYNEHILYIPDITGLLFLEVIYKSNKIKVVIIYFAVFLGMKLVQLEKIG